MKDDHESSTRYKQDERHSVQETLFHIHPKKVSSILCLPDFRIQLDRADSFSSCYSFDSDDCEKKAPK